MRAYPGLMPWHLDRMYPAELDVLIDALNAEANEQRRAQARANRT